MLIIPPPIYRKRRRTARSRRLALMLVAATYEPATTVRLTFNQPIDISGIVYGAILVDDQEFEGERYEGIEEATLTDPMTVSIPLWSVGPALQSGVRLSASAGTGIVAVTSGAEWAGVMDLALPFP